MTTASIYRFSMASSSLSMRMVLMTPMQEGIQCSRLVVPGASRIGSGVINAKALPLLEVQATVPPEESTTTTGVRIIHSPSMTQYSKARMDGSGAINVKGFALLAAQILVPARMAASMTTTAVVITNWPLGKLGSGVRTSGSGATSVKVFRSAGIVPKVRAQEEVPIIMPAAEITRCSSTVRT